MPQEIKVSDNYIDRLEDAFKSIMEGYREIVLPQFKSDIESLRERLINIREFANVASTARYLKNAQPEVILANLIMQVLSEADDIDKLKPVKSANQDGADKNGENFFEILAGNNEIKLDEALSGFDFFDNNPYRKMAEKKLAKQKAKKGERK